MRLAMYGLGARSRLERFVVIVHERSTGRAARVLDSSIGTLCRQLHRLEGCVGGPLFLRSPAKALDTLTPLGEQLYRQAREYLGIETSPEPDAASGITTT
ncbi:LysR family transcriptional regulator [Micromonospora sp. NBC_01412]|uniref:LysR family transcriptional regulator n=1 Tax=Micromonospora sp. NBC_01412 TaxID=2903590 RepID=UPI00324D1559